MIIPFSSSFISLILTLLISLHFIILNHCMLICWCYSMGPMAIIYLTLLLCLVQCLLYLAMWLLARQPSTPATNSINVIDKWISWSISYKADRKLWMLAAVRWGTATVKWSTATVLLLYSLLYSERKNKETGLRTTSLQMKNIEEKLRSTGSWLYATTFLNHHHGWLLFCKEKATVYWQNHLVSDKIIACSTLYSWL